MKGRYESSTLSEDSKVNRSVRRMVDEGEYGANTNRNRNYYFSVLFLICTTAKSFCSCREMKPGRCVRWLRNAVFKSKTKCE